MINFSFILLKNQILFNYVEWSSLLVDIDMNECGSMWNEDAGLCVGKHEQWIKCGINFNKNAKQCPE